MHQRNLLDDVKLHFDDWRATRTKRGKIPDYLWDKVKSLIGNYSLTAITEALSINTSQMREHLDMTDTASFVEISINKSVSSLPIKKPKSIPDHKAQTYAIEVHRTNGTILKIAALSVESLNTIITQFME